ncbi:uncharacterized protein LOC123406291 isoform X1 [Hordeum vulgare subsp. vulgare]|uniref:uncharacterized protein LOC123406291 isoform X1 n=1 Tax=Hordeum vulgare subsp. vulgare TaxID=112509 RepID=UPI00162D0FC1|nr:uncharacterized protein LOC123406291 isoform X1 [Hordeum vulgare subsp. vulgare]
MQEYWASVGCRSTGPPSDAGVLGLRRMRRHAVQQHQITTLFLSSTPTCIRQLCRFTSSSINQWLIDIMTVLDFPNQSIEQVGAGTMNPLTFIRVLGREPWNVARCSSLGCSGDRFVLSISSIDSGLSRMVWVQGIFDAIVRWHVCDLLLLFVLSTLSLSVGFWEFALLSICVMQSSFPCPFVLFIVFFGLAYNLLVMLNILLPVVRHL